NRGAGNRRSATILDFNRQGGRILTDQHLSVLAAGHGDQVGRERRAASSASATTPGHRQGEPGNEGTPPGSAHEMPPSRALTAGNPIDAGLAFWTGRACSCK